MDTLLVPNRCYFYISTGESAPPFSLSLVPNLGAINVPGWSSLGHTGRGSIFSLAKDNPSEEDAALLYEEYPSLCTYSDYWKFEVPLIGITRESLKVAFPGAENSANGLAIVGGLSRPRSVLAIFEDSQRVFALYFQRVKIKAENGFAMGLNEQTVIPLSGFVMRPTDSSFGKFMVLEN